MFKVIAEDFIKKEYIEMVIPLYKELVESTRKEEGCLDYRLFIDEKDEGHFVFIEEWKDSEALDKHCASEHFKNLIPRINEYAEKEGKATIMREFDY